MMIYQRIPPLRFQLFLAGWTCLSLAGCGQSGPPRFALSGQVTYDGQPITDGDIGFIPGDPDTGISSGADIVDGRYEIPSYEGPTEGTYKVVIFAERPSGRKIQADESSSELVDQMEQFIPDDYNAQSSLTVDISSDQENLDFNLEKVNPRSSRR